jgi:hypothetical protein
MDDDWGTTRPTDHVMDRWLLRQLRLAYDEIVEEPVPVELLDLVEEIGRRASTKH